MEKLRGIDFGNVSNASGGRNFHGIGYWFHTLLRWLGLLCYTGSTFVAKTFTLRPHDGFMPLKKDGVTPTELFPGCIIAKFRKGVVLNKVGLSGPGAEPLFQSGIWQSRKEPFFLSFAAVSTSAMERVRETDAFLYMLEKHLPDFRAKVGLQINFSCPNTEVERGFRELQQEIDDTLGIVWNRGLPVPIVIKLNALTPVKLACAIAKHNSCDAICISNTIPWGALPDRIPWKKLFGSDISPLAGYGGDPGGGGLSGKPLLPIVTDWIKQARAEGLTKPIIGCGGILSKRDADAMLDAGANAVELGCVSILRPWRVAGIIKHINHRCQERR